MKILGFGSTLICAAAMFCSMSTAASAQNLVRNGGFEDYTLKSGSWSVFGVNSQNKFGWSPTEGSQIEIRNNVAGTAAEGVHYAELDSHYYNQNANEIGLFQDIVTEIGRQYSLSFNYGPREQQHVNGDNLFAVSFGDFYQEFDAGNYKDGWQFFNTTITATSDVTRLKFLSLGKRDTYGANVDNIIVESMAEPTAVPEPFSIIGASVALGAGAILKQRKK